MAARLPYVFGTGALLAAEQRDRRVWSLYADAVATARKMIVSTPVITQAWRHGSRQASLAMFLKGCKIDPPSEKIARSAGELLGRTGKRDAVDAIVVATALEYQASSIFSSDTDDLAALCQASDARKTPLLHRV